MVDEGGPFHQRIGDNDVGIADGIQVQADGQPWGRMDASAGRIQLDLQGGGQHVADDQAFLIVGVEPTSDVHTRGRREIEAETLGVPCDVCGVNDGGQGSGETQRYDHVDFFVEQGFGSEHAIGGIHKGYRINVYSQLSRVFGNLLDGEYMRRPGRTVETPNVVHVRVLQRQQLHNFLV